MDQIYTHDIDALLTTMACDDLFIEDKSNDGMVLNGVIEESVHTPVLVNNMELDPEVVLTSLSNLKKYRVSLLCTIDLKKYGWKKLGANMEEERMHIKLQLSR